MKIADFGIAKCMGNLEYELQLADTTCGTPGFVAPEVLEGELYGASCDCWSIGVLTYILITGNPPFYADDIFNLFEVVKKCEYSMSETDPVWSNVTVLAKDFIRRILVADPSQRLTL